MRFGANYIPSKNWLHCWSVWDTKSIEEDLVAIKGLGADHLRVNLMWHYFQFDKAAMSKQAMKNLEEFMSLCEKVEIDCCIALFTGFMSGFFFYPSWQEKITGKFGEGIFSHPEMLEAEEFYIRSIAEVVTKSDRFLGFDLGNELSVIIDRADKAVSQEQCDAWCRRMLEICEEAAPNKMHNNGVDHLPWLTGRCFSRKTLANTGAITPLHCYSYFTEAECRFGRDSTESVHLAPFMAEIAKAYDEDISRPYWVQEFGSAGLRLSPETEKFLYNSVNAMYSIENLWGISWWCTHNVSTDYATFDDLEYELGLLTTENKPTRVGLLFKQIVEEFKANGKAAPKREVAFVLKQPENGISTLDGIWENGHRYAQLINEGIYPAIVLEEKKNDAEYLKKRGIKKVIEF